MPAWVLAAALAAGFAAEAASAQEAIMLETIGAVRMAQPEEMNRMTVEREARAATGERPQRDEREASAR